MPRRWRRETPRAGSRQTRRGASQARSRKRSAERREARRQSMTTRIGDGCRGRQAAASGAGGVARRRLTSALKATSLAATRVEAAQSDSGEAISAGLAP